MDTVSNKKPYHVCKSSRIYIGVPYCGPTSKNKPASYDSFKKAIKAAAYFDSINFVGWVVYDSDTGNVVFSTVGE